LISGRNLPLRPENELNIKQSEAEIEVKKKEFVPQSTARLEE
jgi:hypothetical protein